MAACGTRLPRKKNNPFVTPVKVSVHSLFTRQEKGRHYHKLHPSKA